MRLNVACLALLECELHVRSNTIYALYLFFYLVTKATAQNEAGNLIPEQSQVRALRSRYSVQLGGPSHRKKCAFVSLRSVLKGYVDNYCTKPCIQVGHCLDRNRYRKCRSVE